jgi:hypothetical protein
MNVSSHVEQEVLGKAEELSPQLKQKICRHNEEISDQSRILGSGFDDW